MAFGSSLQDSSSTMNELSYDAFYLENNPYKYTIDDSQPFLAQTFYTDFPQINPNSISDASQTGDLQSNFSNSDFAINKGESPEYCEITSNVSLNFISQMLLEEGIDEKAHTDCEEAKIREAEKPFYDILGQEYPSVGPHTVNSPVESNNSSDRSVSSNSSSGPSVGGLIDSYWTRDLSPQTQFSSVSSSTSTNVRNLPSERSNERLVSTGTGFVPDLKIDDLPAWQFQKGVEEAKKFLPSIENLVIDLETNEPKKETQTRPVIKEEKELSVFGMRGRKNPYNEDLEILEERSGKQSALSSDEPIRDENFDKVLLSHGEGCTDEIHQLRGIMESEASKGSKDNQEKGKSRNKKNTKKDVVDLRTLLIHCAQAIATDDWRQANELLKKIRKHVSQDGDSCQRLAGCFADGLEARLAGTGSQIYNKRISMRTSATDYLKAYHLYLTACPFVRATYFFSNKTILNLTKHASRIHVIDFGIYFGFQWPSLIEHLVKRKGDAPRLRITGIEVPQPGFRPTQQLEETGRRLSDYARSFNVPFEYKSIASKWETIRVEDLKIRKDEVVIVNCLYRFRNLVDETVAMDSPRDKVLKMIRKINPSVFIHAVVNGSYGAPFFVTRFREVLFHYSSLFDMLDTTVPRNDEQRGLIERGIFGRDALNVIACEGSERVERPETYRQWQVRNLRAGFEQLPVDREILKIIKDKVKELHHRDFVVDEDCKWLLQGWKGRIIYAMSTWKPNLSYSL
ncbi:hypothetical protein LUZ60_003814 [Juncus effusus]|nr:hypothetical protein LUZ60_003814 [Juncus effusus]